MANVRDNAGVIQLRDRNAHGHDRFVWTDELKDDLMKAYQESSPQRHGYMRRLHERWCTRRPELSDKTQQQLRNKAKELVARGWVVVHPAAQPAAQVVVPAQVPVPPQIIAIPPRDVDLGARRVNINKKARLQPQDLARLDEEIGNRLPEDADLWTVNCAVYDAAVSLLPPRREQRQGAEDRAQLQIRKLEVKITATRKRASRIQCVMDYMTSGRPFTAKVRRIAKDLRRQLHTLTTALLTVEKQHCLERLRALMAAKKMQRKRLAGIKDNEMFSSNPSRLFQEPSPVVENPPTEDRVREFWRAIYEQPALFNQHTPAIQDFTRFCNRNLSDEGEACHSITEEEVSRALKGVKNHSAPGPDGITNFWWKKFPSIYKHLARIFSSWLMDGEPIPRWLVEGRTVLIPKKGDLADPKNYRPITCLNTCYKIFTTILNTRILRVIDPVWRQIYEQRGSKKGVMGCKENLLIDRCVTQDSRQHHRNLSMAWIDYRKAFDTTSHELLVHLLECLKVSPNIVRCIQNLLPCWRTRFTIKTGGRAVSTEPVSYRRGVFQGDTLSPLLFCISLLPLSVSLENTPGYKCGDPKFRDHKITHLFYMDDLKLYASGQTGLRQAIRVVEEYTRDIGMEFGLDKCAVIHLQRGRVGEGIEGDVELIDGRMMRQLRGEETYQYLGVAQSGIQDAGEVKRSLQDKYKRLTRKIWSSELTGKNKVTATNMLAVPIVSYSFGVVKWTMKELDDLDVTTRKIMFHNHSHHPISSVVRVSLPREKGGRGLLSLKCVHNRVVLDMASAILKNEDDPLLRLVHHHERGDYGAFLYKAAERAADTLGLRFTIRPQLNTRAHVGNVTNDTLARLRQVVKQAEVANLYTVHVEKDLHGVFYRLVRDLKLSTELTFSFLMSAGLKSETEGFIVACQDGVIKTNSYKRVVLKQNVIDRCRLCGHQGESLMHLLSACPAITQTRYVHRHNAALRVLYYHLRHAYGIDETPVLPYAPGDIEAVVENERCTIYWNFSFNTTRLLTATKPDIVLRDSETQEIYIIEFSAPCDKNIVVKEGEKRAKYQDLGVELKKMYPGYSVKIVVLIIGVLGGMRDTFLKDLKVIPACRDNSLSLACRMQKAVIHGSLRILGSLDLTGA